MSFELTFLHQKLAFGRKKAHLFAREVTRLLFCLFLIVFLYNESIIIADFDFGTRKMRKIFNLITIKL